MIYKIYFIMAALLMSVSGISQTDGIVLDKVIAVVGDEPVLLSELQEGTSYLVSQGYTPDDMMICNVLEQQITQKLLLNNAGRDSIIVGDKEVRDAVDQRIEGILKYLGSEEAFKNYYGKSVYQVRKEMSGSMKDQMMVQRLQGKLASEVSVTPSEVKKFYYSLPEDSIPYLQSEVQIREIVVLPQVNKEEKQKALDKITELRTQIVQQGADFGGLASAYSQDPGSAVNGGNLGEVGRGSFVPEFEAAAYNLEIGEVSDVVETAFGFHIIKLLGRRGNFITTQHILISPEITIEDEIAAKDKLEEIRQEIESGEITFGKAVEKYSDDDQQSKLRAGFVSNSASGNTRFGLDELPFDIFFAIEDLKEGEVSKTLSFKTFKGQNAYRIVELNSQTDPHKMNLEQDYDKIKNAALERQKAIMLDKWIKKSIEDTYLYIDPDFAACPNLEIWLASSKQNVTYSK